MNILFIHPNFPAQFRHVASALGGNPANRVVFATANPRPEWDIAGVDKIVFPGDASPKPTDSPYGNLMSRTAARGERVVKLLRQLKDQGFTPDIIYGHSGWGTTLYLDEVYPDVPFVGYFEWFYRNKGSDMAFDPEFPISLSQRRLIPFKNMPILNDLVACRRGICPTHWQQKQFPAEYGNKLEVLHDGIDTDFFSPAPDEELRLGNLCFPAGSKLVTYCARGFEPYRGFHQFMRAIPLILERDPSCRIILAGSDRVCYGARRPDGKGYQEALVAETDFDQTRVHFVGSLPYGQYRALLRASAAHVYLTYPFVLSWSLLEAMACGCLVFASDTDPVREVVKDGVNGMLIDFFNPEDIAGKVVSGLSYPRMLATMRENARQTIVEQYNLHTLLPQHLALLDRLAHTVDKGGPFG